MKQLLYFTSVLILFLSPVISLAQLNHFVYLQTENKQPFYVKMDKKIFNSTLSGYLIIPKLQDGAYNFSIGFLNNENKEHDFSCSIDNKDVGYLVKNFADKGWGLFNLQSLQVIMSAAKNQDIAQINKKDAFSNLLSDVVNDPAIKQENQLVIENKGKSAIQQDVTNIPKISPAASVTAIDITKTASGQLDTSISEKHNLFSTITKKEVLNSQDGLHVTYVDFLNGVPDTVTVFIPAEKDEKRDSFKTSSNEFTNDTTLKREDVLLVQSDNSFKSNDTIQAASQNSSKLAGEVVSPAKEGKKEEDKKFWEIDLSNSSQPKTDSAIVKRVVENSSEQATNSTLMINSDCKTKALEEDFLKLRKKMASAKSEEDMLASAKKTFKSKCFTTDQVKNLGVLFLKDSDRYNFFDVAYPFVSDTNNYKQLEDQLTDAYYKSRFHAMIRH